MQRTYSTLLILAFAALQATALGGEGNWNQFRGPNGDGKSLAKNLPVEFSEPKNVRWKVPIHGKGHSSPVVWGDQIWLTTAREDGAELFAMCIDLETGKTIHDIKVFDVAEPQTEHAQLNSHATPTPVVEEGRIFVHFGAYGTACLDTASGKKLWEQRGLHCDHRVRPASSPIVDDDALFVASTVSIGSFSSLSIRRPVRSCGGGTATSNRIGPTHWRSAASIRKRPSRRNLATTKNRMRRRHSSNTTAVGN